MSQVRGVGISRTDRGADMARKCRSGLRRRWGIAGTALLVGTMPAAAGTLTLQLAGEAYLGQPEFSVMANDAVFGTGTLTQAVDTALGEALSNETLSSRVENFSFEFNDALLTEAVVFSVQLTTDAYGGEGSGKDQNLYLAGIAVDGTTVALDKLTLSRDGTETPIALRYGAAPLYKRTDRLSFTLNRVAMADPVVQAAPVTANCPAGAVSVTGFQINSSAVPGGATLPPVAVPSGCMIVVSGYSSQTGPVEWNQRLALMRAEAVRDVLLATGIAAELLRVAPGQTTDSFGADAASNQRVVISYEPYP